MREREEEGGLVLARRRRTPLVLSPWHGYPGLHDKPHHVTKQPL